MLTFAAPAQLTLGTNKSSPSISLFKLIVRFIILPNSVCWVSSADLPKVAMDSTRLAPYIGHSVSVGGGI